MRTDFSSDNITVEDLEIFTFIGLHEFEHRERQKLLVSLVLEVPTLDKAAAEDDISLSLNWSALCDLVARVAGERPRKLVEALTYDIAKAVLREFPVTTVWVEVKKCARADARWLSVRMKRSR